MEKQLINELLIALKDMIDVASKLATDEEDIQPELTVARIVIEEADKYLKGE